MPWKMVILKVEGKIYLLKNEEGKAGWFSIDVTTVTRTQTENKSIGLKKTLSFPSNKKLR